MDFKPPKFKDHYTEQSKYDEKLALGVGDELNLARNKILLLKSEKKRLQEALRTVIVERNKKSEKLKIVMDKYEQLSKYLKKNHEFIQEFRKDYESLSKNRDVYKKHSKNKSEIQECFRLVKSYAKKDQISLSIDNTLVDSLKGSVKSEKWDEFTLRVLKVLVNATKMQEFVEEDTPQFNKQTTDNKIDVFLENSKILLDSLAFSQEKLRKISDECFKPKGQVGKHAKTLSYAPELKVLTPTVTDRGTKCSFYDNFSNLGTAKARSSVSRENFNSKKKNRLLKDTD